MSKLVRCPDHNGDRQPDSTLIIKSALGGAFVLLAAAGAVVPGLAEAGITWGQGIVAAIGAVIGALLALRV